MKSQAFYGLVLAWAHNFTGSVLKRQLFLSTAIVLGGILLASAAEIRTFRKEIRQVMGSAFSQDEARIAAIARAKREALEAAGTYLETLSVVHNAELEKDEILALSSGVLSSEIVAEEPFLEGGVFGIRVVAVVRVDSSTLDRRIEKLLADNQLLESLNAAQRREKELLDKIKALAGKIARLEQRNAPAEEREALKTSFRRTNRQLAAEAWIVLGMNLRDDEDIDSITQALEYFNKAIAIDPSFAFAYDSRGYTHYRLKQYEQTVEDYSNAIRLNPEHPIVHIFYFHRAVAYNFLGDYFRAIEDLNFVLMLKPRDLSTLHVRGASYVQLGDYQNAISDYNLILTIDPTNSEYYYLRGGTYRDLEQYKQAIKDYDRAIQINPAYVEAYNYRGESYASLKEYDRAIADYNDAIQIAPDKHAGYYFRGTVYIKLGQYHRAIEDFTISIKLNPDSAYNYNNRGCAYHNLEQYEIAIADYDIALRLDPEFALTYANRGGAYFKIKNYGYAIANFDKALEIDPNYAAAYFYRGLANMNLEKYPMAIADFDKAITIDPKFALAYANRGIAKYELGKEDLGCRDGNKACELGEDQACELVKEYCQY